MKFERELIDIGEWLFFFAKLESKRTIGLARAVTIQTSP